jgi:SAM-dependent methyltransferase
VSDCRLCRDPLDAAPRIRVAPAPSGAQHFALTVEEARMRAITLELAQCLACGLVQSLSAPVEGHRRAISAAGVSGPMREHRLAQARRLAAARGKGGGRIALVGCGNGYELPLLQDAGFQPVGVESGGPPAGYNGPWLIHDGYPGAAAPLPGAPYDAFACYNFLEHADDPRGFLRAIAASLKPGSCGVIEVPNFERQRSEGRAADYIADHLSYFDARTLRAVLLIAGFDVLSLTEVRGGENLEAIVRRAPEPAITRDGALLDSARKMLRQFFASWKGKGAPAVAWGASHQALTLYAGLSESERPRVILDGAAFKQGMYAPATAIPVVAPSVETLAGAGAVLVVASGFETEIVKSLRGKLGFGGEIWTVQGSDLRRLD